MFYVAMTMFYGHELVMGKQELDLMVVAGKILHAVIITDYRCFLTVRRVRPL